MENFSYKAKILLAQHKYDEVIEVCTEGLQADPDHSAGRIIFAKALMALARYEDVLDQVLPLLEKESNYPGAHRLIGEAYLRLNKAEEARKYLKIAKKSQPYSMSIIRLFDELESTSSGSHPIYSSDDEEKTSTDSPFSNNLEDHGKSQAASIALGSSDLLDLRDPDDQVDQGASEVSTEFDKTSLSVTLPEHSSDEGSPPEKPPEEYDETVATVLPEFREQHKVDEADKIDKPDEVDKAENKEVSTQDSEARTTPHQVEKTSGSSTVSLKENKEIKAHYRSATPEGAIRDFDGTDSFSTNAEGRTVDEDLADDRQQLSKAVSDEETRPVVIKDISEQPQRDSSPLLSSPLDPSEFKISKPSLPDPEKSIPLHTKDIIVEDLKESAQANPLDEPLSPDEFSQRKLPPMSPLDQPISPKDFTSGPHANPLDQDPLSEPFWPDDFVTNAKGSKPPQGPLDQDQGDTASVKTEPVTPRPSSHPPPRPSPMAPQAVTHAIGPVVSGEPQVPISAQETSKVKALSAETPPEKKKKTPLLYALIGVLSLLVLIGLVFSFIAYLNSREMNELESQAQTLLLRGNYSDYQEASKIYEGLLASYSSNADFLSESARIYALTALEFGTDHDGMAEEMMSRAKKAGASQGQLSSAEVALNIFRGNLDKADVILTASQEIQSENTTELIYLRGLWYLRQENVGEALRRFTPASEASPQDLRNLVAQAKALFLQGNHQEAFQRLDDLMKISPDHVPGHLLLARMDIETGRHPEGGEQAAERVLLSLSEKSSPGQLGWAKLIRARFFVLTHQRAKALELALSAKQAVPRNDPEFHSLLARTFLDLDDAQSAVGEARKSVDLSSELPRYRLVLSESFLKVGDLDSAEEYLQKVAPSPRSYLLGGQLDLARGQYEKADALFLKVSDGEREAPHAKMYLAQSYLARGENEKAIETLEALRKGGPALPRSLLTLSEAYLVSNRLSQAEALIQKASADFPDDPFVLIAQSRLSSRKGQDDRALSSLQKALSLAPNHSDALLALGSLHLRFGEAKRAFSTYEKILKRSSLNTDALIGRARCAIYLKQYEEAQAVLKKATNFSPPGYVERTLGELKLRQYNPSEAIPLLVKALKSLPNDVYAHTLLGDAYVMQAGPKSSRRALASYRRALRLWPDFPQALIGIAEASLLGSNVSFAERSIESASTKIAGRKISPFLEARSLTLKGRYAFEIEGNAQVAQKHLKKALDVHEDLAEAHLSLGFTHEDRGNKREACTHFRRYLELAEKGPTTDVAAAKRGVSDSCR